jgi:hypothetical protein
VQVAKIINAGDRTVLIPKLLDGGSTEHYYHFLMDFVLPIESIFQQIPTQFLLKPSDINYLFSRVIDNFKIRVDAKPNKIILIERSFPSDFYLKSSEIKGGGSLRRSIKNHKQLKEALENLVSDEYNFLNVQLEKLTFHDQVNLFANAALVIGQHGAGLTNILWMKSNSIVLELGHNENKHFEYISKTKKVNYRSISFSEPHITVDIDNILNILSNIGSTKKFFSDAGK